MTKFYDAKDDADLARVEALLHQAGIEYAVCAQAGGGIVKEVEVAEEDVPRAEEILLRDAPKR